MRPARPSPRAKGGNDEKDSQGSIEALRNQRAHAALLRRDRAFAPKRGHTGRLQAVWQGRALPPATNPVFPEIAVYERLGWAGLNPEDFSYITTYENSCFAKPNIDYYKFLLKMLDKDSEDCLMVGNDVHEDMVARNIGIDVFLIEGYVENQFNEDTFDIKKGNWNLFKEYISNLPNLN